jgi:ElaB/YqjD/DUF883 family membrane-anchored ribosome-binding protein
MELYFKNLISEEASLDKLVDDLTLVVHGAHDFANAVGANLSQQSREEVAGGLQRIKEGCLKLRKQTMASARATDRLLRENPWPFVGVAFAVGWLLGTRVLSRK